MVRSDGGRSAVVSRAYRRISNDRSYNFPWAPPAPSHVSVCLRFINKNLSVLSFVRGTRAPGRKQLQWSGRSMRISYLVSNSEQETRARNEKFYYSIEKKRIGKLQGRRLYCLNFFLMISWKVITIIVVISFYVNINFIFNKFSKRQLHRTIDPIYKYFRSKSLFVFMDT